MEGDGKMQSCTKGGEENKEEKGSDNKKSNKSYIISLLATQMILIPIILTIGSFLVSVIIELILPSSLGNNSVQLIIFLVAISSSLTVGGLVGAAFSRLSTKKPDSLLARFLPAFVPILYALVFAILAIVFSEGDYGSSWWSAYLLKNPTFLPLYLALFFSGLPLIVPIVELMGYTGFLLGLFFYEFRLNTVMKNNSLRSLIAGIVVISVTIVGFSGVAARDIINNGLIELRYGVSTVGNDLTEFDLLKIAPFNDNNGLAKLQKPASLQFTDLDTMPRLDGATAAYPVYAAFVEAVYNGLGEYYEANKNNNKIDTYAAFVSSEVFPFNIVKCSKTGGAYDRLINGQTDIIFVAEPSKEHAEAIKAKGDDFRLTPIGSEAFVFFTNAQNPVETLSIKQIQDIYSGQITNWKEVGGENKNILPYQRPDNSGSQTVMQNWVMKEVVMAEPTKETYAGGMGEIISRVAGYRNAENSIGYSFMYYASEMINNQQIKFISIDGIKPNSETIRNKTYPFTVPVYAVTLKSNEDENVHKFLEWLLSEEAQGLVDKTGYTSIKGYDQGLRH